jgi:hypothetical protein
MINDSNVIFQDPIILAAGLVFIAAVIILVWAVKSIYTFASDDTEITPYDEEPSETANTYENSGLIEARLAEINNQLAAIEQRLNELQKSITENKNSDNTMPNMGTVNIDPIVEKIESKLSKLSAAPAAQGQAGKPEDLDRIETKLDSIRKLLILLTDSGHTDE